MDIQLFSSRSIWTMVHGIFLGGGALLLTAAALFSLITMNAATDGTNDRQARYLGWVLLLNCVLLWAAVVIGTYVTFPPYRATPPEGMLDLSRFPRELIRSNPSTAWLHSFAMETKEHVPWIAAMLSTPVAYAGWHGHKQLRNDARLRKIAISLTAIVFVLVAAVSFLGILVNKVAPLQ
jgi:hypothetical protein